MRGRREVDGREREINRKRKSVDCVGESEREIIRARSFKSWRPNW